MRNVTLSVDDNVIERAREAARRRGTTLNALIREYLEELAGNNKRARAAQELSRLWSIEAGHSGGRKIGRDEAYEGRA